MGANLLCNCLKLIQKFHKLLWVSNFQINFLHLKMPLVVCFLIHQSTEVWGFSCALYILFSIFFLPFCVVIYCGFSIYLMSNELEYIFIHLLAMWISSFVMILLKCFAHFSFGHHSFSPSCSLPPLLSSFKYALYFEIILGLQKSCKDNTHILFTQFSPMLAHLS